MSLEEALNRNSDLLEKHNELLEKVLGSAAAKPASPKTSTAKNDDDDDAGDEKPKRGRRAASIPKELKAAIDKTAAWLGEFKDNEDDPENDARGEALQNALDKLGYKTAKEIKGEEDIGRFEAWINKKVKAGRITPDPDEDDDGDDDI